LSPSNQPESAFTWSESPSVKVGFDPASGEKFVAINYKAAEELKRGFYAENKFTLKLRDLAEHVALIEGLKAEELRRRSTEETYDLPFVLPPLLSKVTEAVLEDKPETFERLWYAHEKYVDGFSSLSSYKEEAALHVLVAGQILRLQYLVEGWPSPPPPFDPGELRTLSQTLWARSRCRGKGITEYLSEDNPRLQQELKSLPDPNWPRLMA
jgi:hypothetical protein